MIGLQVLTVEDRIVLASMGVVFAGIVLGAVLDTPQAFGVAALLVFGLLLAGTRATHSARLSWLLLFGLVAGVLELWADWVSVDLTHALVYRDVFGFRLLASPSYMPIGWADTVAQFGYLALRLRERWSAVRVGAALVGLGVLIPPWYEQLAAPARAWYYRTTGPMLSHTPLWIVGTYAACMFFIASAALVFYEKQAWGRAVLGGVFVGAGLLFSSVFWFALLGR
jgi:hypothetical protein